MQSKTKMSYVSVTSIEFINFKSWLYLLEKCGIDALQIQIDGNSVSLSNPPENFSSSTKNDCTILSCIDIAKR